jgi:MarR family transcriptional regulator, temperature-dependent positive regulator of motility
MMSFSIGRPRWFQMERRVGAGPGFVNWFRMGLSRYDARMSSLKKILRRNEIAFGYRIGYLFNHFSGPVYKWTAAEWGLQRPEFATLFCAAHLGDITATDVVTLTGIPKNSVSRAVKRLAEEGWLRSQTDESDGRRAILKLTAAGQRVYEHILPRFRERQERMMAVLTPVERNEFNRLLDKLVERNDDWASDY